MVTTIIFSLNRAIRLELLLESIFKFNSQNYFNQELLNLIQK
jgi:hypothetical protein